MQTSNYGDYAISVVAPDEEQQQIYSNALQLHNGFGHHSTGPSSDVCQSRSGNHSYAFATTSSFNNTRPQLPQLTTDFDQNSSMRTPNYHAGAGSNQGASYVYPASGYTYPTSWVQLNEVYIDPNSPARYERSVDASPNTAGLSPQHMPGTPALGVDGSPSSPAFPSPGSQGSRSSLNPSPSPNLLVHPLTPASVHGSQLSPERYQDHTAIVRSSPGPQYTPLRTTQQLTPQYVTDEGRYTTAQPNYSHVPAYNGQATCGLDLRSVAYPPPSITPHPYSAVGYRPHIEQMQHRSPAQRYSAVEAPADGLGPYIPQRVYRPHTSSDRRRYVEDVDLEPSINFEVVNPPQQGIALRDALTSRFMRLKNRDDLMFANRGPSISVRLVWEGYAPWSRQIPTRDFKSPPGPITRAKLAKNLAKTLQRFIDDHQEQDFNPGSDPRWMVGVGGITLDDLILVSLHHVSMGSWQANLRLARPFAS